MRRHDDYRSFQEGMFQEMQWRHDLVAQSQRTTERNWVLICSTGKVLGLNEQQVLALLRFAVQKGLDGSGLGYIMGVAAQYRNIATV